MKGQYSLKDFKIYFAAAFAIGLIGGFMISLLVMQVYTANKYKELTTPTSCFKLK